MSIAAVTVVFQIKKLYTYTDSISMIPSKYYDLDS